MSAVSNIEWTDATWNPIVGCSVVSPGCTNCYAMKLAGRRLRNTPKYRGLTQDSNAGPVWTGEVRLWEKSLTDPLLWREPRKIFVNSEGDLFHESIPDEWIDRVFAVMTLCPQHTFRVLTKRAQRMRDYFIKLAADDRACDGLGRWHAECIDDDRWEEMLSLDLPLENVWLGVSCERQQEADERIPLLLQTPAAIRFISAEPLLGPIDLNRIHEEFDGGPAQLDWLIVGGESGPHARPMHPQWARDIRDQCQAAGVPFFFKQWGVWCHDEGVGRKEMRGDDQPHAIDERWSLIRVGKKAAGRLLDGVEHNGFPGGAS